MIQWTYPQEADGGRIEQSKTPEHQLCLRYCVAKVTVARMTVARKHSEVPTATKKTARIWVLLDCQQHAQLNCEDSLRNNYKSCVLVTEKKKTPATGPLSKK
jgi:hypothetical protein